MIKTLYYYIFVIFYMLFLISCTTHQVEQLKLFSIESSKKKFEKNLKRKNQKLDNQSSPSLQRRTHPFDEINQDNTINEIKHYYNWNDAIKIMVNQISNIPDINLGSILLVDDVSNYTNGSLDTDEATRILRDALSNNSKFNLISVEHVLLVKKELGLLPKDRFGTRSKTIAISRNAGAQYVLYSIVSGNIDTPSLQMQLMLVQSGEIIWSGQSNLEQE